MYCFVVSTVIFSGLKNEIEQIKNQDGFFSTEFFLAKVTEGNIKIKGLTIGLQTH